jgi:uncharacterized ParB-like nuclease family protein
MKSRLFPAILAVVALVLAGGCGKSPKQEAEEAQKKVEEARQQLEEKMPGGLGQVTEAVEKMGEAMKAGKAEPVDSRELEKLLPAAAGGLPRTEASGEKTDQMGVKVSVARAVYERGEEPGRIDLQIVDLGSLTGFAAVGATAWAMADVNNQDEDGYEKTFLYSGCKAYEKYDRPGRQGELKVLVADRFVLEISGSDVSMDEIKAAAGAVDLGRLKAMKGVGVAK